MSNTFRALLEIARPKQWVKNAFVFAPLLFAQEVLNPVNVMRTCFAFIIFSMFSSCVYMINDIADTERDKNHPEKRKRPLPSGGYPSLPLYWHVWECLIAANAAIALSMYMFLGGNPLCCDQSALLLLAQVQGHHGWNVYCCGICTADCCRCFCHREGGVDWLYICAIFVSLSSPLQASP